MAALVVALLVAAPAPASATPPAVQNIYDDCDDGVLDARYTNAQLNAALRDIDAHTGEYSECADVIVATQNGLSGANAKAGKDARDGGAGGSSGGSGTSSAGAGALAGQGATGAPAAAGGTASDGTAASAPALSPTDGRDASEA